MFARVVNIWLRCYKVLINKNILHLSLYEIMYLRRAQLHNVNKRNVVQSVQMFKLEMAQNKCLFQKSKNIDGSKLKHEKFFINLTFSHSLND